VIFDFSLLHQAAEECLEKGISVCRDGVNYRKIGKKIRSFFLLYHKVAKLIIFSQVLAV